MFNAIMHCREVGNHLMVYSSIVQKMLPRLLHEQLIFFQSVANNVDRDIETRKMKMQMTDIDEDQGVGDFLHEIEDSDNGYEEARGGGGGEYIFYLLYSTVFGIYIGGTPKKS